MWSLTTVRSPWRSFLFLLLLQITSPAAGWGFIGHRLVCDIAYRELDPGARTEVDALIDGYRKPNGKRFRSYVDSCVLPDLARRNARDGAKRWQRFRRFDRWHFMNVSRRDTVVTAKYCRNDCLLYAIEYHVGVLRDRENLLQQRAEALIFLSHWIADIHQPLHVAFEDDKGGSAIAMPAGGYFDAKHFHALWDTAIVKRARGRLTSRAYAARLRAAIREPERGRWRAVQQPLAWAQESYVIATSKAFNYCYWDGGFCRPYGAAPQLGKSYQKQFAPLAERRLQQAAVRLTDVIERLLAGQD